MNNQNNTPNTTQANTNQYDLNIENSRTLNAQTGTNINQNPYINQNLNPLQTPQPMQTKSTKHLTKQVLPLAITFNLQVPLVLPLFLRQVI